MAQDAPKKSRLRTFTRADAESMFKFLEKVIMDHKTPVLPPEYADWDTFHSLYQHTSEIKNALINFAKGELDLRMVKKGATSGNLKAILANLQHLAWQFKVAASGDFSHTVDYMGEFSEAFNLMTSSLARNERQLREKQEELAKLTVELRKEIRRRDQVEAALKASESNYRDLALHDPLTKIYNRGYFNEAGGREVEIVRRRGEELALLMMDLDKFKRFNDTFGHLSGDAALIHTTVIVRELQRKTDIFARYGGEEFVLLLPQTNLNDSLDIGERLRREIASRFDPAPNCHDPITISIGIAALTQRTAVKARNTEALLKLLTSRADEALYMAKTLGGNKVCAYGVDVNAPTEEELAEEAREEAVLWASKHKEGAPAFGQETGQGTVPEPGPGSVPEPGPEFVQEEDGWGRGAGDPAAQPRREDGEASRGGAPPYAEPELPPYAAELPRVPGEERQPLSPVPAFPPAMPRGDRPAPPPGVAEPPLEPAAEFQPPEAARAKGASPVSGPALQPDPGPAPREGDAGLPGVPPAQESQEGSSPVTAGK
ncbi:MAG: diguanylate cyclase [Deltaproteobacteria bacterium]|nr:diguanylate cyclase [Deltaproteobacteria bacterium]